MLGGRREELGVYALALFVHKTNRPSNSHRLMPFKEFSFHIAPWLPTPTR